MKSKKIIFAVAFSLIAAAMLFVNASATVVDDNPFDDVVLGVGVDETQKNLNWYSTVSDAGAVEYAPAEDLGTLLFPTQYTTVKATIARAQIKSGYYVNRATITNLKENTEYVYRLRVGNKVSDVYRFNTGNFGDYEFVVVGDPQVKNENDEKMWTDTLNKIYTNFGDAELLLSAGDQVNSMGAEIGTAVAEEHWSRFFVDELTSVTFAPTPGPAHDVTSGDYVYSSYGEHFNLPNLSDKYGVTTSTANYWYVYNNTLFINLNIGDAGAVKSEHKQFILEAMRTNPNVTWNVVFIHYPFYSVGDHAHPENQYYDYVTKEKREALAPQFTELGIDLVISGHDHLYVRSEIMDGLEVSDDVIENNSVTDPSGPLYVVAGSATGNMCDTRSLSYDEAYYAAKINDESRKSIIRFKVTDKSITLEAYFIDKDEPELFDSFIINKTPHIHSAEKIPAVEVTCTTGGNNEYWYCESCNRYFIDEDCTVLTTPEEQTLTKTGHKWKESNCTSPKVCLNDGCTATQGVPKGHNATSPTCTEDSVCKRCDEIVSEALGHDFSNACDTSCDREDCDYVREVPAHVDSDNNLLCDECGIAIDSPTKDDRDGKETVIVIISSVIGAILICGAIVAVFVIKKKRH